MEGRVLILTVTGEQAGRKVDTLLRRELGLSGTVVRRAKTIPGGIRLDGEPVFVTVRAQAGQLLTVFVGDRGPGTIVPVDGALDLAYEDEDILVVNKAPGLPVHPGPGHYDDTLGNILAGYYKRTGVCADYHPVHRLDKGTSGLMVVAKHPYAQEKLKAQLHTGAFRRGYLAVCQGAPEPPEGRVELQIARVEGSLMKREVRPDGAYACTLYKTLERWKDRSLVQLRLETGRTHQIRVHMAYLGCPLTGDFLYGIEDRALIARPALHSAELRLDHPVTGEPLSCTAPLPEDMQKLLK